MTMERIYKRPGHLLRRAQQISDAVFFAECNHLLLTSVQYATLVAIEAHPGVDATQLSTLIAFDRSTLGGVLERLELKDLIHRKPSPHDKRVKLLFLTQNGRKILEEIEPNVERVQERILTPLAAPEREMLMTLLTKLVDLHNETLPLSLQVRSPKKTKKKRARHDPNKALARPGGPGAE